MTTPKGNEDDAASIDQRTRGKFCNYWHDGRVLFRYRLSGDGGTLVVLDSGMSDSSEIWAIVAPQVATMAHVLVVDRCTIGAEPMTVAPEGQKASVQHLVAFVEQAALGKHVVLAGWAAGCLTVQQLAVNRPDHYLGMVLINPVPVAALDPHAFERLTKLQRDNSPNRHLLEELSVFVKGFENYSLVIDDTHAFERILVTILLPGNSPDPTDDLGKKLIELQRQDIERFSHPREIIAGRSRSAIPIERPDVVVDAIGDIVSQIVSARASQTQ